MAEPRYKPNWTSSGGEIFLGHAGEVDVYFEDHGKEAFVYVVGPVDRYLRSGSYNFDAYDITADSVLIQGDHEARDIHLELHEMCELYKILTDWGYLKEQADGLHK